MLCASGENRFHGQSPKPAGHRLLAIAMMVHKGLGVSLVPDIAWPLTRGLTLTRLIGHIERKPQITPQHVGTVGSMRCAVPAALHALGDCHHGFEQKCYCFHSNKVPYSMPN